jgi:hypothetical protein
LNSGSVTVKLIVWGVKFKWPLAVF